MFTLLIFGLLFLQQPAASIEGVVVKAGTNDPIPRAVVELRTGKESQPVVTATGGDGRFVFRNLAAGSYRLSAARNNYIETSYGQRGPNGIGSELPVEVGQSIKDIRLSMIAYGAISGRIYDSAGDPLPNVTVNALKYSYKNGERNLTPVRTDRTDDRGEYRLFWLPPGQYYISASAQGLPFAELGVWATEHQSLDSNGMIVDSTRTLAEKLGEALAPVYYPGTADSQAASPVQVGSATDLSGIDFILSRVSMRKIRGVALDSKSAQLANRVTITLVPRNRSIMTPTVRGFTQADGTFELQGVIPGFYFVIATSRIVGADRSDVRILGGQTAVDVVNSDVERVAIALSPPTDVSGEIIVEGPRDITGQDWHPVIVLKNEIRSGLPGQSTEMFASIDSDNREFVINDVIEGDYQVQFENLPNSAYLKSVRLGAVDVLNGAMHIDSRTNERLQIVASGNAGTLEGTVVGRNGEVAANAPVAIVPDAARRQSANLYKSATTDAAGRFRIQGIAPGTYSAFAWEDIEEGLWRDPEFIRRNEASGRPVRILEGTRETVELTAIPFAF